VPNKPLQPTRLTAASLLRSSRTLSQPRSWAATTLAGLMSIEDRLKTVGWLWVAYGSVNIFADLPQMPPGYVNPDWVALPIGVGLLAKRPSARSCALAYSWLCGLLVVLGVFVPFVLEEFARGGVLKLGPIRFWWSPPVHRPLHVLIKALGLVVVLVWQYRQLTDRRAPRLFGRSVAWDRMGAS